MAEEVTLDAIDGVLVITINRPQARNAVNLAVAEGISAALDRLDADPVLRVGILTGAGGTFSAGMDLKAFVRGERPIIPGRGLAGLTQQPPVTPLIAAVEGYALAGGFELVLACDLVVAGQSASFGIPEVKRGLVAAAGGLLRLPRRVSQTQAMELALLGDPIDAPRAHQLGLINRVVPDGTALRTARELAAKITANGPLAVATSKRLITESVDWPMSEAFARQAPIVSAISGSADAREGATAFAEKRAPRWTGQ